MESESSALNKTVKTMQTMMMPVEYIDELKQSPIILQLATALVQAALFLFTHPQLVKTVSKRIKYYTRESIAKAIPILFVGITSIAYDFFSTSKDVVDTFLLHHISCLVVFFVLKHPNIPSFKRALGIEPSSHPARQVIGLSLAAATIIYALANNEALIVRERELTVLHFNAIDSYEIVDGRLNHQMFTAFNKYFEKHVDLGHKDLRSFDLTQEPVERGQLGAIVTYMVAYKNQWGLGASRSVDRGAADLPSYYPRDTLTLASANETNLFKGILASFLGKTVQEISKYGVRYKDMEKLVKGIITLLGVDYNKTDLLHIDDGSRD